jgi:hypothetical protein
VKTGAAAIVFLILIAAAILVPVMACPYCHRHRLPFILWIVREIEEMYSGERTTGKCIPDQF